MKFSVQPVLLALESPMVTVHTRKGYLEYPMFLCTGYTRYKMSLFFLYKSKKIEDFFYC